MLELRGKRDYIVTVVIDGALRKNMSHVFGKCNRIVETGYRDFREEEIGPRFSVVGKSYTLFAKIEVTALPYVRISLRVFRLMALIDSGLGSTIMGPEGIEVLRRVGVSVETDNDLCIRTAGSELAQLCEKTTVTRLQRVEREMTVYILDMDFLRHLVSMSVLLPECGISRTRRLLDIVS